MARNAASAGTLPTAVNGAACVGARTSYRRDLPLRGPFRRPTNGFINCGRALAGYATSEAQKAGAPPSDLGPSAPEAGGSLELAKGSLSPVAAPSTPTATSWSF